MFLSNLYWICNTIDSLGFKLLQRIVLGLENIILNIKNKQNNSFGWDARYRVGELGFRVIIQALGYHRTFMVKELNYIRFKSV